MLPGSTLSATKRSGRADSHQRKASSADEAAITRQPRFSRTRRYRVSEAGSSSNTRTVRILALWSRVFPWQTSLTILWKLVWARSHAVHGMIPHGQRSGASADAILLDLTGSRHDSPGGSTNERSHLG